GFTFLRVYQPAAAQERIQPLEMRKGRPGQTRPVRGSDGYTNSAAGLSQAPAEAVAGAQYGQPPVGAWAAWETLTRGMNSRTFVNTCIHPVSNCIPAWQGPGKIHRFRGGPGRGCMLHENAGPAGIPLFFRNCRAFQSFAWL